MNGPEPRKLLVIQLRRIGDVILTTPAVAALARSFPRAQIDFLAEPPGAEALAGNPHIRTLHVYRAGGLLEALSWLRKIRAQRYDWVIDYLSNPRSALIAFFSAAPVRAGLARSSHRWAYNRFLGRPAKTVYTGLEKILALESLGVDSREADFLPRLYLARKPARPANRVGLVPASRKPTRRWPSASYARLGRLLRERCGCEILVFWGPGERGLAEEVARGIGDGARVTPETRTLGEAACLMADCRLIVTNCNGPKHMAVGLGIPTLTIHGSSDPASWTPPHPSHAAVRLEELFCIGCRLNKCPYGMECMKNLAPERVAAAAERLLGAEARA